MMALFRCSTLLFAALLVLASTTLSAATAQAQGSQADDREARKLFEAGQVAFAESRFERALKYFQEAYGLSPSRHVMLYNIGMTYDRLRRDREAIDAFEQYLHLVPNAENREAVQTRIDTLEAGLASTPTAPTPAETAQASLSQDAATAQAPPIDTSEPPRPFYKRWWFWGSIGAAVVAGVVTGVALSSGSNPKQEGPLTIDAMTRVHEL